MTGEKWGEQMPFSPYGGRFVNIFTKNSPVEQTANNVFNEKHLLYTVQIDKLYLFILAVLQGLQDLSLLTRYWTWALGNERAES